jgi:1,4-alpha-glucan branching enzyme
VLTLNGIVGTSFCVWALNARRVSVVREFNRWEGRYGLMRMLGSSGLWEPLVPPNLLHCHYKYEIIGTDRALRLKTDPHAFAFAAPPPPPITLPL